MIFRLSVTNNSATLSTRTTTEQQARELAAQFPKTVQAEGGALGGDPDHRGYLSVRAALAKNGVNGGVNETGLRRINRAIQVAKTLGTVEYHLDYSNSLPADELAAFGVTL